MFELTPCPYCDGRNDDCTDCHGTNRVPMLRCPASQVTRREIDVVTSVGMTQVGVLPSPGGWFDQPHTWVKAWPVVMREISKWQQVHQERAAAAARQKPGKKRG